MPKRKARTTINDDLRQLEADLVTYFKRSLSDAASPVFPVRADACRYCWGLNHAWQWKSAREYQAALVSGDLADPDLSDKGGYGFRPSRGPNPECPECDGRGVLDHAAGILASLPEGLLYRVRSMSVTMRGVSLTTFGAHDTLAVAARFAQQGLSRPPDVEAENPFAAALRAIGKEGSAAPIVNDCSHASKSRQKA